LGCVYFWPFFFHKPFCDGLKWTILWCQIGTLGYPRSPKVDPLWPHGLPLTIYKDSMIPILGSNYSIFKGLIISWSKLCGHQCDSILALVNYSWLINFNQIHLINQFHPSSIEQNCYCCSIQTVVDLEHSSSSQYVTRQKYFSHPSVVIYSFPTPHIKLKLQLQMGGRLVIATHLDQSNYLANQQ
jgi:hypothetical protein